MPLSLGLESGLDSIVALANVLAERRRPAVVLMDVCMPELDGFELAARQAERLTLVSELDPTNPDHRLSAHVATKIVESQMVGSLPS